MKKDKLISILLIALLFLAACSSQKEEKLVDVTKLGGEYLGEQFPYGEAQVFLDNLIKDKYSLQNLVFSSDGKEFYFTRTTIDNDSAIIFTSKLVNDNWTEPEPLPFIDEYSYTDPFVTYDNSRLYFASDRPTPREGEHYFDFNIWYVERTGDSWSDPKFIFEINSMEDEYFPSLTDDGTIYFSSAREGAEGYWDIYKSEFNDGRFTEPTRLPAPINGGTRDFDPFISNDGSELFFTSEREDGYGGGDIYYSKRIEGDWSELIALGKKINTNDYEYCPRISYDNKFLFFTRVVQNEENFYQEKGGDTRDPFEYIYLPEAGISRVYWMMKDSLSAFKP